MSEAKARTLDLRRFNMRPEDIGLKTQVAGCKAVVLLIDWPQVVVDLEAAGHTQRSIALACGFTDREADMNGKAWVNKLKSGIHSEPKFHHGAMLIGLWSEVVGRHTADLPKVEK